MVISKKRRLTKDRAKAILALGLDDARSTHGEDELASAAACCPKVIENAIGCKSLPEAHFIFNTLTIDPRPVQGLVEQFGWRLVSKDAVSVTEKQAAPCIVSLLHKVIEAERDGRIDHAELLAMKDELAEARTCIDALLEGISEIRKPREVM